MDSKGPFRFVILLTFLIAIFGSAPQCRAQFSDPSNSATSIPASEQIQPAALVKLLHDHASERPLLLQVGSHVMFAQAHIPGSIYAGPASQPAGLKLLESSVASSAKNRLIIIYCGCCPWGRCPNMGPAYKRLRELGFTNVKALFLANNFGDDWVGKGFPIEQGE